MTPKLARMRDELAEKTALAIRNVTPHGSPLPGTHNTCVQSYRAGFTAAHDQLMPVVEEMKKILKHYAEKHLYDDRIEPPLKSGGCPVVVYDLGLDPCGEIARIALKKAREILE